MFQPVPKDFDVPALERDIFRFWEDNEVERRYVERNRDAEEIFSFLDGPITANGPMGVHHAWGRTYKDLWQRYNTMLGKRQRYQNGFDCQGLWVEVTVEKQLGFANKRDIEAYGIADFVRRCKEDVFHWADIQTRQSRRLGYFMDWPNSYYTLSDENNYTIWHFLKKCHEKGLIYRGTDVMPWCTRCGTGLSEHEIATEGYQELTHRSVFVRFPLAGRPHQYLLVWTTTPWTLTSNVAVAVNPDLAYAEVRQGDDTYFLAKGALRNLRGPYEVTRELLGSEMLGWHYAGPFDDFPAEEGAQHVVIPWDDVSEDEGTGLVHIAPGAGKEDFALGKQFGLKVVAPLDQDGVYLPGFDWLTGQNVHDVTDQIIDSLDQRGFLYYPQQYTHRYPVCWRCGTELVFRLVGEWFIAMDPLREPMMEITRQIRWLPPYGLDRELDWLRNMSDWMISKKRYWGLALPFWICPDGHLNVIGGKEELFRRAIGGVQELESPHRPWVDEIKVACDQCGQVAERILDVGNPWLDAGIVPYSTMRYDTDQAYWRVWFPAQFITESFPGQFRNWFYSMLAMSTVLENRPPYETVLGYALVRDEHDEEMHKSKGNAIPFDEAADRVGADVMRWLFCLHNPETNLLFGYAPLNEVKRRLLVLWNTYSFFVTYANVDRWSPDVEAPAVVDRPLLDRWVLARLHQVIRFVRLGLDHYDSQQPAREIERFIEDLSTWYVRRSRRRFWRAENDEDKYAAYATLYECLTTLTRLMAPFTPFLAESIYQNLVRAVEPSSDLSVHLTAYPEADENLIDEQLLDAMGVAQHVVGLGRAARETSNLQVRQPLAMMWVRAPTESDESAIRQLEEIILDELNVKRLELAPSESEFVSYSIRPNLPVLGPKYGRSVPQVRAALEALPPAEVAGRVAAGESIELILDGRTVSLSPEEVLVSAREREGYAAMSAAGYLVVLDAHLTRDLVYEGLSRQVVRRLNDWRRSAGFTIEDRVAVRYQASSELAEAIKEFKEYIQQETLATSLEESPLDGAGFQGEAEFGEQWLQVALTRSTAANR